MRVTYALNWSDFCWNTVSSCFNLSSSPLSFNKNAQILKCKNKKKHGEWLNYFIFTMLQNDIVSSSWINDLEGVQISNQQKPENVAEWRHA